ncbi:6-bladed beta-propeller [Gracilimonas mengyeensis]|uniref:6-bladed beta-propeller protein n=1 Tax=Gracilimonas mengyeensis TaxID=1302730 RepID=A0A521DCJ0_9BACT|nr:6-bladed beta-propeller [Gracilimonas mengyeensis]SMO69292.1 6-bladed beta-propeller protein [Gracilimonas mengyeensis]
MRAIIILCLISTSLFAQQAHDFEVIGEIDYSFKTENTYDSFDANDDYLVWFEYTRGILFTYDLRTDELEQMKLARGRGPAEFQMISDLYITKNDKIYLADYPNAKLLVWDVKESEFEEDIVLNSPPFRIAGNDYEMFIQGMHMEQPLSKLNLETGEQQTLDIGDGFFNKVKGMERMFNREGNLLLSSDGLLHLSKYQNAITRFKVGEQQKKVEVRTTAFEEPQDLGLESVSTANGGSNYRLNPQELMLAKDMAKREGSEEVYLVLEDNSGSLKYSNKSIYYFSDTLSSEKSPQLVTRLPFAIERLTANSDFFFAYSIEENKVYILE